MSVTYIDAIHQALDELLAEDPDVFLLGEDIAGTFGGAFKATKGLDAKYPGRVLNAPLPRMPLPAWAWVLPWAA